MRYRWTDSSSSSSPSDAETHYSQPPPCRQRRKHHRASSKKMDINDLSLDRPRDNHHPFLSTAAEFLLLFIQGILLPFTTAIRGLIYLIEWALGPDAETTRCVAYTTFDRSWAAHFLNTHQNFLPNNDYEEEEEDDDDVFGVLNRGGILEIRDLGHALSVTTRASAEDSGSEYIAGFAQAVFFVCVDVFVWPVFAIEVLAARQQDGAGGGRGPPWYGDRDDTGLLFWAFLASLVGTWAVFSLIQVMACGRQVFFWRMVLLVAACWIARLWWGAMDGEVNV